MLKELFEAVMEAGHKSRGLRVRRADAEPAHVYYLVNPDGKVQTCEARPSPRDHRAADLETVARWALKFSASSHVAVWLSREGVVAVLDDDSRRDRVTLPLAFSPQLEFVRRLESLKPLTQKAFVRMLRVELAGCLSDCPHLLSAARDLRFHQHADGGSTVKPGAVSIGKTIAASVSGADKLPEEVCLYLPVFSAVVIDDYPVPCAVDVDPEPATPTLHLVPLPGAVEKAAQAAERELDCRLRGLLFGAQEKPNVSLSYGAP